MAARPTAALAAAAAASGGRRVADRRVRGAASVIVAQEVGAAARAAGGPDFRVLMVKRTSRARFMPNMSVFPGGILEAQDSLRRWKQDSPPGATAGVAAVAAATTATVVPASSPPPRRQRELETAAGAEVLGEEEAAAASREQQEQLPLVSLNLAFDEEPDADAEKERERETVRCVDETAFRVAAVRELFEETGLLLATRPCGSVADGLLRASRGGGASVQQSNEDDDPSAARAELLRWRQRVQHDADAFGAMMDGGECAPRTGALLPWDWWVTPREEKHRYNTLFYVAIVREGDDVGAALKDESETQGFAWVTPADALRQQLEGRIGLVPPTWYHLHRLAQYRTLDELVAACSGRAFGVGELTQPKLPTFVTDASGDGYDADDIPTFVGALHGDQHNRVSPGAPGARHRIVTRTRPRGGDQQQASTDAEAEQEAPPVMHFSFENSATGASAKL